MFKATSKSSVRTWRCRVGAKWLYTGEYHAAPRSTTQHTTQEEEKERVGGSIHSTNVQ